jgi:hypothetical protein
VSLEHFSKRGYFYCIKATIPPYPWLSAGQPAPEAPEVSFDDATGAIVIRTDDDRHVRKWLIYRVLDDQTLELLKSSYHIPGNKGHTFVGLQPGR